MTRTVDLVIVGTSPAALAIATAAVERGERVLIVTRASHTRAGHDVQQALRTTSRAGRRRITVLTGADVVCVDGVRHVEAVVVRRTATGRLIEFNASAILFEHSVNTVCCPDQGNL